MLDITLVTVTQGMDNRVIMNGQRRVRLKNNQMQKERDLWCYDFCSILNIARFAIPFFSFARGGSTMVKHLLYHPMVWVSVQLPLLAPAK